MSAKDGLMGRFLGNAEKFSDKQIAETLALFVDHGIKRGASDIHIEPHDRFILVRYRIDGALRGVHKLPLQALPSVMTQLKQLAAMQVQESALPQDGEYEVRVGDRTIMVHVSIMPVYGGEKAVLHLAERPGKPQALEALGFWGEGLTQLQSILANPHGLIIVTGPRHSGISSTLFSLLDQLNNPMISIATVEMRTKHRLTGVTQTYLHVHGMQVREGVEAALKQDPNVLMIGDMPDSATAELAIHAATTGHLVITGFHTEGAVAAALRMRVVGVEPFMLVTALRASIGQRLVRTLCSDCRERYQLTADERKRLEQHFGIATPLARKRVYELERTAARDGLGDPAQLSSSATQISHAWRPHPEGCSSCDHTGYRGRGAIVEVLTNTEALQKGLMDRTVASIPALQKMAVRDGFVPMALDGLIKALRGQTTIAEVLHAVSAPPLA
jgi:type II secretory ATPase GspE/PulE/Tfp pilus assembly ATPase PilB-like protein